MQIYLLVIDIEGKNFVVVKHRNSVYIHIKIWWIVIKDFLGIPYKYNYPPEHTILSLLHHTTLIIFTVPVSFNIFIYSLLPPSSPPHHKHLFPLNLILTPLLSFTTPNPPTSSNTP